MGEEVHLLRRTARRKRRKHLVLSSKEPDASPEALRAAGKPSWAGVAFGGTGRWPASTSVALAEFGFPAAQHRLIL